MINTGKKLSEEVKAKINPLGRTQSKETKEKIAKANTLRIWTQEARLNASKAKKGCIPWNKKL